MMTNLPVVADADVVVGVVNATGVVHSDRKEYL